MEQLLRMELHSQDAVVLEWETIAEEGEEFSVETFVGRGESLPENCSGFIHVQSDRPNALSVLGELPSSAEIFHTPYAILIFAKHGPSLREWATILQTKARTPLRITLGWFKRGTEWLKKNWSCQACKFAVRSLLNAALTAVGIPTPDMLDLIPDFNLDFAERLLEQINLILGEDNPISDILSDIPWQRLKSFSIKRVSEYICRMLGFCTSE
ncbi:MAG: hypothetical protein GYB49_02115 [Alphaproteobacteria bacterium]|nr:hypothetical protein [Hyphomonas sp.]MBR9806004.1 hypothetical protein [Alphaproteobacteria bacterium]|tara:strand:+ start:389 stop:1024 length:636 start_codon:yes stop_codon:yes gene_type:complete